MIIDITNEPGSVQAMGHRVSLEAGGEAELRRRCFETLSRLNAPPDSVVFARAEPRFGEAVDIPASVAILPEPAAQPMADTEPAPESPLPETELPDAVPLRPAPRSHKKRAV